MVSVCVAVITASYGNQIHGDGKVTAGLPRIAAVRVGFAATRAALVGQIAYPGFCLRPACMCWREKHTLGYF